MSMYCYEVPKMRYMKGLLTLSAYQTALSSIAMEKYLTEYSESGGEVGQTRQAFEEALETAKEKFGRDGMSSFDEPYVFLLPDPEHLCMRHGFIWVREKCDTSVVVSPFPLSWIEDL